MPRRSDDRPASHLHLLPMEERLARDREFQASWYEFIAPSCADKTVLDVGAGTGYGVRILREAGAACIGIDPLPARPDVLDTRLEDVPPLSYDWVLAMDVIEHVEGDPENKVLGDVFLSKLVQVAREMVFFTTPNWNRSRCANPHHVFELTPVELKTLVGLAAPQFYLSDDARRITGPFPTVADDEQTANFGVLIRVSS